MEQYIFQPDHLPSVLPLLGNYDTNYAPPLDIDGLYILKPSDANLSADVIVARRPGYPSSFLIGPLAAVRQINEALKIMGQFDYSTKIAQVELNVVISCVINPGTYEYELPSDGLPYSLSLFERLHVGNLKKESMYTPGVGISADMLNPIFFSPNYGLYLDKLGYSPQISTIYWASVLSHEWQHVLQIRAGNTASSLWSERVAMTHQNRFLLHMLNNCQLSLSKEDRQLLERYIDDSRTRIFNYRQGRGFHDHIQYLEQNPEGSESTLLEEE